MADSPKTEPHLRINHPIFEEMMQTKFNAQDRRILDLIFRLSKGCSKDYAIIPKKKDFQIVGVLDVHVQERLTILLEANVICNDGSRYWINENFGEWQITRASTRGNGRLTELVSLNLRGLTDSVRGNTENLTDSVINGPEIHTDSVINGGKTYNGGKEKLTTVVSPSDTNLATRKVSAKESTTHKESSVVSSNNNNAVIAYMNLCGGSISPINSEKIHELIDEFSEQMVIDACDVCKSRGKYHPAINYLRAILYDRVSSQQVIQQPFVNSKLAIYEKYQQIENGRDIAYWTDKSRVAYAAEVAELSEVNSG